MRLRPPSSPRTLNVSPAILSSSAFKISLLLVTLVAGSSSPALAQEEPNERRKMMQERRAERIAKTKERREQLKDPEYVRQNAWWNQDSNISQLNLTTSQRKGADAALVEFVKTREQRITTNQKAQEAFFDALGTEASAQELARLSDAMIASMTANSRSNADLRIAVMAVLTSEQRAQIAKTKARLLRSDWTGGNAQRRAQRSGGGNNRD